MKSFLSLFVVFLLFTVCGCSSHPTPEKNIPSNTQEHVLKDFKTSVDFIVEPKIANQKIQIIGKTNLPDDTELMISISSENPKYLAQDKVTVKNGTFTSSTFSDKGNGLTKGDYSILIQSPLVIAQKETVRKIMGENGKNLKGEYVRFDDKFNCNIAFFKTNLAVN